MNPFQKKKALLRLAGLTGVITLSLTACGGAGDAGAPTPSPVPPPPVSSPPASPPPAGPCPSGSTGQVGVFEQLTIPGVRLASSGAAWSPGGIVTVALDPKDSRVVYAGTDSFGLYKSSACGADGSWSKVNTGRNAAMVDSGITWVLAIDQDDPKVIYVTAMYGSTTGLLKSINGGVDWDLIFPTPEIAPIIDWVQGIAIDPTNHLHVLLSTHNDCKGAYAPACMAESYDAGKTWRLFKVPTSGWSHSAGPVPLGGKTFLYAAGASGLFWTNDGGDTWSPSLAASSFPSIYQAKDKSYYLGSTDGVLRSPDGRDWTLVPNSGRPLAIAGDGTRLFTSDLVNLQQPFATALESDATKWSALPSPTMQATPSSLVYDADHHILYMPTTRSGLWRLVTQ